MNHIQFTLITILFILLISYSASAIGIGIAPSSMTLEDAAKGEVYEKTLRIYNRFDEDTNFELLAEGDIKPWVRYYIPGTEEEVDLIQIGGDGHKDLTVKFNIPSDAANGDYAGNLMVKNVASYDSQGQQVQNVRFVAFSRVSIKVTGVQNLDGEIERISILDIEENRLLDITVKFKNTGNVVANPRFNIKILKKGDKVADFDYQNESVKPGYNTMIHIPWDSFGHIVGEYSANIFLFLDGNLISEHTEDFMILERGTFTANASFSELRYPEEVEVGKTAKIEADVRNIGRLNIDAKLLCEINSEGELIDTLEGDFLTIPRIKKETLTVYFKENNVGIYNFICKILYEGKRIDLDGFSITVVEEGILQAGSQESDQGIIGFQEGGEVGFKPQNNTLFYFLVIIFIILIIIALLLWNRRRL